MVSLKEAFGVGGSNAHMVVAEYQEPPRDIIDISDTLAIIPLSAKSSQQLSQYASHLRTFLHNNVCIFDLAYTLQVGREAMEYRVAFVVNSIAKLQEKLQQFVAGDKNSEDCYVGERKSNKEAVAVFGDDEELQEAVTKWIVRRKFAKLAGLWVRFANLLIFVKQSLLYKIAMK